MIRTKVCAFLLLVALVGCREKTREAPVADQRAATKPAVPAKVDPSPPATVQPEIVERETIAVSGRPACALTVRYPGRTDQPVTWNGEECGQITTVFADTTKLKSLGKWERLTQETRDDVARTGGKVLYIEGESTASIYPLNVAGRVYDVPVAD